MKHSFSNLLLWEDKYPMILDSHDGTADTGEHSTNLSRHTAGLLSADNHIIRHTTGILIPCENEQKKQF